MRSFLESLTEDEASELEYRWPFWARPDQLPPPGEWTTWLCLSGRGWGKTRVATEWVRMQVESGQASRIALVGETAADVRDVMVRGDSGFLSCSPPWFRPKYIGSRRRLEWPNGAYALLFNATEPDQLRGPQFDCAAVDELAKFEYAQATWDMLQFGMRLGAHPRQIVTTTPRPIKTLLSIMRDPGTVLTTGSTFDNRENLAPTFLDTIRRRYEGTRLGRQELYADVLDDTPGALWTRAQLDRSLVTRLPPMKRVVIGVDPSISSSEDADAAGIVCAGLGSDNRYYILEDGTREQATPDQWGKAVVKMFDSQHADRVAAEKNQGGEMVGFVVATAAQALRAQGTRPSSTINVHLVSAKRSKYLRAEPVSALYEQGRVSHAAPFPSLEDEMCTYVPGNSQDSPNRLDAMVYAVTDLMTTEEYVSYSGPLPF